ncbi:MAG: hypothetical protein EAZ80_08805, partial [Runella slithyformis]
IARFNSTYPCNSKMMITTLSERKAKSCDRLDDLELNPAEFDLAISSEDLIKITDELIDNAFKYSQKGSKVFVSSQINNQGWIFSIHDEGRGMTDQQIADIGSGALRDDLLLYGPHGTAKSTTARLISYARHKQMPNSQTYIAGSRMENAVAAKKIMEDFEGQYKFLPFFSGFDVIIVDAIGRVKRHHRVGHLGGLPCYLFF